MEPVRNDTTADRRTAVELAKRLLVDSIWRTAKIEVDGVTFPDTQEIFDGRAPEGMSVDDIVTVNNIKRAWRFLLDNIDYPVDWQYIREYNRIIGEGLVRDAGRLREYGVRIGGTGWVPEIPTVESPQERVRGILEESEGEDTAMLLFGAVTRGQWFSDGNKRTALMVASNQHEFGGNDALRRLLGTGEDRRASQGHGIPTALMYLSDDDAPAVADLETTWYDARRNNPNRSAEWRLYYKDCEPIRMARPGDLMCFGMLRNNRLLIIIAQHDSTAEAQAKWLFGIDDEQEGAFRFHDNTERELDAFGAQIFEALGINVEVRDDTYLPEMIGRWGYRFPSNEEFAAFSQSSLTDVDPTHDDPDDVVIEYYDRSYLLFKLYERAVIQHDYDAAPFVSDGVIDVDSFTSFYTSVRNRRMSRAGKVLEIHIAHILDARGIEYEAQAKTENGKKPDFLFPSQAAYEDPAFPEEQLRMLASKTSIKDRFRQVADEANRIRDKHLFTLTPGDVTHPKLAQLDELHIHLVMPKVVKESYDDLIQGETMTFSRFIEEIQGLQADRPQSLTLL